MGSGKTRLLLVAVLTLLIGVALVRLWDPTGETAPASPEPESEPEPLALLEGDAALLDPAPPPIHAGVGLASDAFVWPLPRGHFTSTEFQYRVALGGYINALLADLDAGKLTAVEVSKRFRRPPFREEALKSFDLLDLDDVVGFEMAQDVDFGKDPPERFPIREFLEYLASRGLDLETLKLRGGRLSKDPMGRDLPIRIWQRKRPFEKRHLILNAEALLRRLNESSATRRDRGYDVLASPKLGAEIFPELGSLEGYAGLYFIGDKLAIMRSTYKDRFAQRVLNHELIHAWQYRHYFGWDRSFCIEGLASYLEWWRTADPSYEIPLGRLRNDFALLVEWIDWIEARLGRPLKISMPKLIDASRRFFYAFSPITYLIAEAAFAYLSTQDHGAALAAALSDKREYGEYGEIQLAQALGSVSWQDLMAFVREHGKEGVAAEARLTTDEATYGWDFRGIYAMADEMRETGLELHPAWIRSRSRPAITLDQVRSSTSLRQTLKDLRSARMAGTLALITDVSEEMAAQIDIHRSLPNIRAPRFEVVPHSVTRAAYVQQWLDGLRDLRTEKPIPAFEAADPVSTLTEPVASEPRPLDMKAMRQWINDPGEERKALIICMAARDDAWFLKMRQALEKYGFITRGASDEEVITAYALASRAGAAGRKARYSSMLFVDLAGGNPHCIMFARAWATAFGDSLRVAYWDPQQPLPQRPK